MFPHSTFLKQSCKCTLPAEDIIQNYWSTLEHGTPVCVCYPGQELLGWDGFVFRPGQSDTSHKEAATKARTPAFARHTPAWLVSSAALEAAPRAQTCSLASTAQAAPQTSISIAVEHARFAVA